MTRLRVDATGLPADLLTVEILARLCLVARRCGYALVLHGAGDDLRELVAFMGLDGVLPCDR